MWWNAPLVSIDLIVTNPHNQVLLGWRNNKPAQHRWFVPGGVVRKSETLQQAFERVLLDELGAQANLDRTKLFAGVYGHHYADNFAGTEVVGTYYAVLAHRLSVEQHLPGLGDLDGLPKAQHNQYVRIPLAELLSSPQVHRNTRAYFQAQSGR